MDVRSVIKLPKIFTTTKFDDFSVEFKSLHNMSSTELASIVESRNLDARTRYAAGTILSFIGDPRISVFEPKMIDIPEKKVTLGLNPSKVERIASYYKHLGVISEWIEKECPEYQVEISRFRIAKYCVTNIEFKKFLTETGFDEIPSSWEFGIFPSHKANHPVYTVSAEAADTYCSWLSKKTNRSFRLPTEQEWEYVASNGVQNEFPWGNSFELGLSNTVEEEIYRSTPVGMFPNGANIFGILDLAGNVEEYTASAYQPYPLGEKIIDDLLPKEGTYRVARGGSFTRFSDLARAKRRHGWYKKEISIMGFRMVESISQEDNPLGV